MTFNTNQTAPYSNNQFTIDSDYCSSVWLSSVNSRDVTSNPFSSSESASYRSFPSTTTSNATICAPSNSNGNDTRLFSSSESQCFAFFFNKAQSEFFHFGYYPLEEQMSHSSEFRGFRRRCKGCGFVGNKSEIMRHWARLLQISVARPLKFSSRCYRCRHFVDKVFGVVCALHGEYACTCYQANCRALSLIVRCVNHSKDDCAHNVRLSRVRH